MYLAVTYQEYITEHEMNVYSSKQIDVPKPEFYIVYTGDRQFTKDTISLREDFFGDPELAVDLSAKVIYAESKDDIIGQYIIFSHIVDRQIKEYGRTKKAIENAIRICSDSGVLKEYLDGRRKEVIDVMITLFDQGYAVDAYAKELAREAAKEGEKKGEKKGERRGEKKGLEKGIRVTVEMCQEIGMDISGAIDKLSSKYELPRERAAEYVEKYWQKTD